MKKEDFLTMLEGIDFEEAISFNMTIITKDQKQININNYTEY